jgi:hypothetical protein
MKPDVELIDAYHSATSDYEAAQAGAGDRLVAFIRLLVAERVLATRLPGQHLVSWPPGSVERKSLPWRLSPL